MDELNAGEELDCHGEDSLREKTGMKIFSKVLMFEIIFDRDKKKLCVKHSRAQNQYRANNGNDLLQFHFPSFWFNLSGNTFNVNFLPQMSNKSSKLGPSNSMTKALYFPQGPGMGACY